MEMLAKKGSFEKPVTLPVVTLLHWLAWYPGFTHTTDLINWRSRRFEAIGMESPPVDFVPPLLRRRMSRLSRMVTYVAMRCCNEAGIAPNSVSVVFASYHGELLSTVDMLGQIKKGEPISPTDFTISVHHSPISIFSLVTGNQHTNRAIAGGEESFCYGFLDAMGLLLQGDKPVLFITGDDHLPLPFSNLVSQPSIPNVVALLLRKDPVPGNLRISLTMEIPSQNERSVNSLSNASPSLDFVRWLLIGEQKWSISSKKRIWTWRRYPPL